MFNKSPKDDKWFTKPGNNQPHKVDRFLESVLNNGNPEDAETHHVMKEFLKGKDLFNIPKELSKTPFHLPTPKMMPSENNNLKSSQPYAKANCAVSPETTVDVVNDKIATAYTSLKKKIIRQLKNN